MMKRKMMKRKHNPNGHNDMGHSYAMMMPRDAAGASYDMLEETQMYHKEKGYYGPGYGHPSNMPPYPDMHYYPEGPSYLHTDKYPDTIREIDEDADDNSANLDRQPSDTMY